MDTRGGMQKIRWKPDDCAAFRKEAVTVRRIRLSGTIGNLMLVIARPNLPEQTELLDLLED
jgi:hypothetical protein